MVKVLCITGTVVLVLVGLCVALWLISLFVNGVHALAEAVAAARDERRKRREKLARESLKARERELFNRERELARIPR